MSKNNDNLILAFLLLNGWLLCGITVELFDDAFREIGAMLMGFGFLVHSVRYFYKYFTMPEEKEKVDGVEATA